MKVIFEPKNKDIILEQLEKVAMNYQTKVIPHDEGKGHFIFVRSKIKITESFTENKVLIHVSGANEEDITFLKRFWGEPVEIKKEKMTPQEFASEIVVIPNVDRLNKQEIIEILKITEAEFNQYSRFLKRLVKKPKIEEDILKAISLIENKK